MAYTGFLRTTEWLEMLIEHQEVETASSCFSSLVLVAGSRSEPMKQGDSVEGCNTFTVPENISDFRSTSKISCNAFPHAFALPN